MTRQEYLRSIYSLEGQVAVVTGGTGVLGYEMAMALAMAGARVGILGRRASVAAEVAAAIQARGGEALAIPADVLSRDSLSMARDKLLKQWGAAHTLVNAAGGNVPAATVGDAADVFAMSPSAFPEVVELNLTGALLPALVFGEAIVKSGGGSIVNVSSMGAARALTRVAGYGAGKAGVGNLTRWVEGGLGRRHGALVPGKWKGAGFFFGSADRALPYGAYRSPT